MRNIDPETRHRQFVQDTIQKLSRLMLIIHYPFLAEGWSEQQDTEERKGAECRDNSQAIAAKPKDL